MKWHQRFFWLLLLFLPTQLGYHFWPDWAGVLGRRVDYLAPTIYLTDILLFAMLFFWLFESFSRIRNQESGIRKGRGSCILRMIHDSKFMIPLLGFAVVNVLMAQNRYVAGYKWLKVVEFMFLGWYIVRTRPKLSSLSFPLSVGVFYSSILAITQFVLQHSIGSPLWWLGERTFTVDTPGIARIALNWSLGFGHWDFGLRMRPYATFPHPNVLGGFLAVTLPIVSVRLLGRIRHLGDTKKRENFFYGVTFAMGVIALLLTFSRSAIVVGVIAIVAAIANIKYQRSPPKADQPLAEKIKNTNQKLKIIKFVVSVIIAVIAIYLLSSIFYLSIFQPGEESIVVRQQLNVAAIKLWQSSPLFGVGLGNFLVRLPEALPTRTIYFLQPVHNIYLLILSEVGFVGLLLFGWFVLPIIKNYELGIRNYGKRRSTDSFIIRTSLFIILTLGLVDHYSLSLQQGQLLLTVLAGMSIASVH